MSFLCKICCSNQFDVYDSYRGETPPDPASYYSPAKYHRNPHTISNPDLEFLEITGNSVRCRLHKRTWTWNLEKVLGEISGMSFFQRQCNLLGCTPPEIMNSVQNLSFQLNLFYFHRNIYLLDRKIEQKNDKVRNSVILRICSLFLWVVTCGRHSLINPSTFEMINMHSSILQNGRGFFAYYLSRLPGVEVVLKKSTDSSVNETTINEAMEAYKEQGGKLSDYLEIRGEGLSLELLYQANTDPRTREAYEKLRKAGCYIIDHMLHGNLLDREDS